MRGIKLLLIVVMAIGCSRANPTSPEKYDPIEVLKDYSTCQCLTFAFKRQGLDIGQKDVSIAVLSDLAGMNMQVLREIDTYVASQVDSMLVEAPGTKSLYKEKAITMKCLDFSRGKILDKYLSAHIKALKNAKDVKQRYGE